MHFYYLLLIFVQDSYVQRARVLRKIIHSNIKDNAFGIISGVLRTSSAVSKVTKVPECGFVWVMCYIFKTSLQYSN